VYRVWDAPLHESGEGSGLQERGDGYTAGGGDAGAVRHGYKAVHGYEAEECDLRAG
jgi:ribosomal protein L15